MRKKLTVIIALIIFAGMFYWHSLNSPADKKGDKPVIFSVARGEAVDQITSRLKEENLIKSALYFKYVLKRRGDLKILAGDYSFGSGLTTEDIVKILTLGQSISQEKKIRIIEGWSRKDIGEYLAKNQVVSSDEFLSASGAKSWNFSRWDFLNNEIAPASLEGYLFPDTYQIFKTSTAEQIIDKMLSNFGKKLNSEMRQEIKRQNKTIHEIVTMASVIEKEVRTEEDMKVVSGIFWDRIKNGQALESCATLAYILGVNKAQYSLEDTKINSPYNTYRNRGLPPGPIANPGLNAIMAAIYPVFTEYNYFLSDPGTGRTIYGKTLEEHNRNKAKYLK